MENLKEGVLLSYKETLVGVGDALIYYTPIDTGLASSNWNVGVNAATTEREVHAGRKGIAASEAMASQIEGLPLGVNVVFSNPVEYIGDLERGKSRQALGGMVTPTRAKVNDIWIERLKVNGII